MLNRLPKDPPKFADLVRDLGSPKDLAISRALGVSERTVRRWMRGKAPRSAVLSLWWLSQEGHSTWDAEMHNRTCLAIQTNEALWREIGELRAAVAALDGTKASQLDDERRPRRLSLVR
jgi:transcriptional regulator with XRE-family HTH domain